jgi:hypothetical protein
LGKPQIDQSRKTSVRSGEVFPGAKFENLRIDYYLGSRISRATGGGSYGHHDRQIPAIYGGRQSESHLIKAGLIQRHITGRSYLGGANRYSDGIRRRATHAREMDLEYGWH